jgi:hypothetical protein
LNAAQIRAVAGSIDSGSSGISCAWVALVSSPISDGEAVLRLEHKISSALATTDWTAHCTREACRGNLLVSIDRTLASAIAAEITEEIVALGSAVRIPGLFGPTGAAMWVSDVEPGAGAVDQSPGPLSVLPGGWAMWHHPGAWCALISGKPSQMVRVARRVGACRHDRPLPALIQACTEQGVDRMIAVSDGTGTPSGYGGAAYCWDGKARAILLP